LNSKSGGSAAQSYSGSATLSVCARACGDEFALVAVGPEARRGVFDLGFDMARRELADGRKLGSTASQAAVALADGEGDWGARAGSAAPTDDGALESSGAVSWTGCVAGASGKDQSQKREVGASCSERTRPAMPDNLSARPKRGLSDGLTDD